LTGGAYSDRIPTAFEDNDRVFAGYSQVEMTEEEIDTLDNLQRKRANGTAISDL
jgi:hypothetical protein